MRLVGGGLRWVFQRIITTGLSTQAKILAYDCLLIFYNLKKCQHPCSMCSFVFFPGRQCFFLTVKYKDRRSSFPSASWNKLGLVEKNAMERMFTIHDFCDKYPHQMVVTCSNVFPRIFQHTPQKSWTSLSLKAWPCHTWEPMGTWGSG